MSVVGAYRPHPLLPVVAIVTVALLSLPASIRIGARVGGSRPLVGSLAATTKVIAADGSVVEALHGEVDRRPIPLDAIPRHARNAIVAIEDRRFYRHDGVDPRGTARALVANVRNGRSASQGGSTITQQLVKNLYFRNQPRTLWRKGVEAVLTLGLERISSKEDILEAYLNTAYFGRGSYGIQAAARAFFSRDAGDLTLAESAYLAGLVHMPGRYDWSASQPADVQGAKRDAATARRNHVLSVMADVGAIDRGEAREAAREPLDVVPPPERRWMHPYVVDTVLRELGVLRSSGDAKLSDRFSFLGETPSERARAVYAGGLEIHTTIDPAAQRNAEAAVADELPGGSLPSLSSAFVALDPSTGAVRALVGGRDYYPDGCETAPEDDLPAACRHSRVNLALGNAAGGSGRQAGSAFKPFVLAAALENGVSLEQKVNSSPFQHRLDRDDTWKVENYEGDGGGVIDIIDATARSVNAAYARLEVDVLGDGDAIEGASKVAAVARKLGIPFPTEEEVKERCGDRFLKTPACTPADRTPSIALGAREISPLDLAAAYATFANDGVYNRPTTIARITDASGEELYRARPEEHRAISSETARGVSYVLQKVVQEGTGRRAQLDRPAAGKTGTSQGWRDAWFAGYVPQLVAVAWVGNPTPVQTRSGTWVVESMVPSNGYGTRIVGGSYPARMWRSFMAPTLERTPEADFPEAPKSLFEREVKEIADEGVPSVVGASRAEASAALRAAGFQVVTNVACPPDGSSGMQIYAQEPPPGTELPEGSVVTIWSSRAVCKAGRSYEIGRGTEGIGTGTP